MIISKLIDIDKTKNGLSIKIPESISYPLGIKPRSQVFIYRFKETDSNRQGVVIKIIPDARNPVANQSLYSLKIKMKDSPGTIASISKTLKDLKISILWSQQFSIKPHEDSVWNLVIENRDNQSGNGTISTTNLENALKNNERVVDFENSLLSGYKELQNTDKSHTTTRLQYDQSNQNCLILKQDLLNWIIQEIKGQPKQAILYANPENYILTIRFLPPNLEIIRLDFTHRDKIGVIHEISNYLYSTLNADIKYTETNIHKHRGDGNTSTFYVTLQKVIPRRKLKREMRNLIDRTEFHDILDKTNPPYVYSKENWLIRKMRKAVIPVFFTSLAIAIILGCVMGFTDLYFTYYSNTNMSLYQFLINKVWLNYKDLSILSLRSSIYISVTIGFMSIGYSFSNLYHKIRNYSLSLKDND